MGTAISNAVSTLTEVIGDFFTMITTSGTEGSIGMGDIFFLGIGVALSLTAVSFIKRLVWGA